MKSKIKELYRASLITEHDSTIIYKIIPGIIILLYYVFSDIVLLEYPQAVYSRILPIALALFLLFHRIFFIHNQTGFRLRVYHVFLASLPIMMYWLCFLHLNQELAIIVSGTILVYFLISLDIKTNKTNTALIYFVPLLIFLAIIFPLTSSKEQIITIMNIPPIVIVGYIINRIQNRLRYKTFKSKHILLLEYKRTEMLYEELHTNNKSLIFQKEEIIKQNEKISQINSELEYKNTQIQKSIIYAYKIQSALLPDEQILKQSFADSFILYYPSNIVSGDFYWFEKIESTTFFAVVDCTGHGVPAAFLSLLGNNILNRSVFEKNLSEPLDIINFLGEELQILFSKNKHSNLQIKDGMDLIVCSYNKDTKKMSYAGTNSSFIVCNDSIHEYKTAKTDIRNLLEIPTTQNTIQLFSCDMVYFFTDGYRDQFGGTKNKKYLKKHFYNTLFSIQHNPCNTQLKKLELDFTIWKHNNEQTDDVLVIGLRV